MTNQLAANAAAPMERCDGRKIKPAAVTIDTGKNGIDDFVAIGRDEKQTVVSHDFALDYPLRLVVSGEFPGVTLSGPFWLFRNTPTDCPGDGFDKTQSAFVTASLDRRQWRE